MISHKITDKIYDEYYDDTFDKNRFWQMVNKIFVELSSSDCSIENAFTIIEIISEINEIADKGTLPDGDSVNISTILWAEDVIQRFREKYRISFKKNGGVSDTR